MDVNGCPLFYDYKANQGVQGFLFSNTDPQIAGIVNHAQYIRNYFGYKSYRLFRIYCSWSVGFTGVTVSNTSGIINTSFSSITWNPAKYRCFLTVQGTVTLSGNVVGNYARLHADLPIDRSMGFLTNLWAFYNVDLTGQTVTISYSGAVVLGCFSL